MAKVPFVASLVDLASKAKAYMDNLTVQTLEAIASDLESKADRPQIIAGAIGTTGWQPSELAEYPYFYDLTVAGVTSSDIPTIRIAPASQATAAACGLCPTCESIPGAVRLLAVQPPAAEIQGELTIEKGV